MKKKQTPNFKQLKMISLEAFVKWNTEAQMKTSWNDGPDQEAVNLNYFILFRAWNKGK